MRYGTLSLRRLTMKPILILGLGNPLQGDDGVGCRVAENCISRSLEPEARRLRRSASADRQ